VKRLRIYIDTSVVGGCLDKGFAQDSCALMGYGTQWRGNLLVSDLLAAELARPPAEVQAIYNGLPATAIESTRRSSETERLRDLYLAAGIVGPACAQDAHHVAIATVAHADVM